MLYNSQQRGLIIDRCWMIYELVSDKLLPSREFHIEYPGLVEFALTSGYFQLLAEIGRRRHFLHIHEEYAFKVLGEQYPDDERGESCLIVGFSGNIPIHAVCGKRGEGVVIITTYVPKAPKFVDPWTRSKEYGR